MCHVRHTKHQQHTRQHLCHALIHDEQKNGERRCQMCGALPSGGQVRRAIDVNSRRLALNCRHWSRLVRKKTEKNTHTDTLTLLSSLESIALCTTGGRASSSGIRQPWSPSTATDNARAERLALWRKLWLKRRISTMFHYPDHTGSAHGRAALRRWYTKESMPAKVAGGVAR